MSFFARADASFFTSSILFFILSSQDDFRSLTQAFAVFVAFQISCRTFARDSHDCPTSFCAFLNFTNVCSISQTEDRILSLVSESNHESAASFAFSSDIASCQKLSVIPESFSASTLAHAKDTQISSIAFV